MAKYDPKTKEGDCIFCKIATGAIKPLGDSTIYEDENYMAWLSPFPNTPGFTVLIPKKHHPSDVLELPDDELTRIILIAKKISKMLIRYYDDVGRVGLMMEGTGIDHAHIKLMPMHGTGHMKKGEWKQYLSDKNDFFEAYPGYLISNDGPKADFEKLASEAKKIREMDR